MEFPNPNAEKHLRVFENRSEYYTESGDQAVFEEGLVTNNAKARIKNIKDAFEAGFLDDLIKDVREGHANPDIQNVNDPTAKSLRRLIDLVTSEVGRALVGLTVMQLSIKSIEPTQNIRLHKASSNRTHFSWKEGVSMRTLDKQYVTPVLRRHNLVKLNADGFMMTRSLAENYPYSPLYKAKIKGARDEWLSIVEALETGDVKPLESLKYLLSLLLNAEEEFSKQADLAVQTCNECINKFTSRASILQLIKRHSESSDYAARLLEIGIHSLVQAAVESGALGDLNLVPLSQMRSANKKHGNIGDIELVESGNIVESWDAKYGKGYLREEIEEVAEKIPNHEHVSLVGFITNTSTTRTSELEDRMQELFDLHGVEFKIVDYDQWVSDFYKRCLDTGLISEADLSKNWCIAYVESLAQKRRNVAPIDEPCQHWIQSLIQELNQA